MGKVTSIFNNLPAYGDFKGFEIALQTWTREICGTAVYTIRVIIPINRRWEKTRLPAQNSHVFVHGTLLGTENTGNLLTLLLKDFSYCVKQTVSGSTATPASDSRHTGPEPTTPRKPGRSKGKVRGTPSMQLLPQIDKELNAIIAPAGSPQNSTSSLPQPSEQDILVNGMYCPFDANTAV